MVVSSDLIARGLGATDLEIGFLPNVEYRLYVRDAMFRRIGRIDVWRSFSFRLVFNGVGTWSLELDSNSIGATWLTKTGGIIVTRVIGITEETLFSGRVSTEYAWTNRTFRAAGKSDESLLELVARPTPSIPVGPFVDEYYVRQGVASTLMLNVIRENIGPTAPAPWAKSNLTFAADPLSGSPTPLPTMRSRIDPLVTLLANFASPFALGFRLQQSDAVANSLEFEVYEPADRSAEAKFSTALGTAQDYEDVSEAPDGNYFYVMLGDSFGPLRSIIEGGSVESVAEWGQYFVRVIDARGINDPVEGQQKLEEQIAQVVSGRNATVTPFDVQSLIFGVNYNLGDLVTIVTQSGEYPEIIRAIDIDLDPEKGAIVVPSIGSGIGTSDEERTTRHIAALMDRIGYLEKNWNIPPGSIDPSMLEANSTLNVGDLRATVRTTAPPKWQFCRGQLLDKRSYPALFAQIGYTYGGDSAFLYALPNLTGRIPAGSGTSFTLGATGGATTASIAHTHSHSHGGGSLTYAHVHLGQTHTHPGVHSHGMNNHVHGYDHHHISNINHVHGTIQSGGVNVDTVAVGTASLGSGTSDHHHAVTIGALGTTNITSGSPVNSGGTPISGNNTDPASGTTNDDGGTAGSYAASYSGSPSAQSSTSWTGGTDSDSQASSVTSVNVQSPYLVINWMIYIGAV